MIGMAAVRKAAKKGYDRYGLPGAVVAGVGTFLGIRFIRRRFGARDESDENQSDESGGQSGAG
jgi:hypothetical protein